VGGGVGGKNGAFERKQFHPLLVEPVQNVLSIARHCGRGGERSSLNSGIGIASAFGKKKKKTERYSQTQICPNGKIVLASAQAKRKKGAEELRCKGSSRCSENTERSPLLQVKDGPRKKKNQRRGGTRTGKGCNLDSAAQHNTRRLIKKKGGRQKEKPAGDSAASRAWRTPTSKCWY